ncbi:MAG: SPFH domain-containing protein, partial [Eubacteriales bacterium]|nr:SPFH domain-containing protein [Eubacteriales bacterium]
MGLIKAVTGAFGGVMSDQYKEFFYCDSLDKEVLVAKGVKRTGSRSQNKGQDNIISNGSAIAVADGQCMLIVEQGEIVEVCAEPGEFIWDASSEPSIFTGKLSESILESFKTFGRRISFGGDTGRDQRVYYFNVKEIVDNKFGTQNPIAFRVVDSKIGLDIDVTVRCNGSYSYHIVDPILFYKNVTGNVSSAYYRSEIDAQMKSELVHHLAPAFAIISEQEVRPNQLMAKGPEIAAALRQQLSGIWSELRGIEIVSLALNSVSIPPEDENLIKQAQRAGMMRDPSLAAANIAAAQADAMRSAAANESGAMTGFLGMGMAGQAGGLNNAELFKL